MKQRSKILTALFLSASLAVTPAASVSVLAEDLDFAAVEEIDVVPEEEISDSEEVSTSTEDSVLAADIRMSQKPELILSKFLLSTVQGLLPACTLWTVLLSPDRTMALIW